MKKTRAALVTLLLIVGLISPAQAVENGIDATGSQFVVPISIDLGNGKFGRCSGALIARSIVVTAGHCVVGANGLITKNIYVGLAGSSASSITLDDLVSSIQITSSFQSSATAVQDDDIAFLTLGKPQTLGIPIILASEKQVIDFKSKASALTSFGYGFYSSSGTESTTYPKSFEGRFSPQNTSYTNSAWMISTKGNSCKGDSGSPILNITATQVTLVGILTGAKQRNTDNCSQVQSDGYFYSIFTLIGRTADLTFSAALDVMNSQEQRITVLNSQLSDKDSQLTQVTSSIADANNHLIALQLSLDYASQDLQDMQKQLIRAKTTITALNKRSSQTLTCQKGKLIQKVMALMSKCPKGYLLKTSP